MADDIQPDSSNTNPPTRARAKVPKILQSPNGEVIKLTRKMRSIVTRIPTAKNVGEIAEEMHCSKGMVYHTMRLPAVQEYLRGLMESAGITHGLLMQRIREGLDATQVTKTGSLHPDFAQRHKTAMDCLRLQGLSAPQEQPDPGQSAGNIYNIVINAREGRGLEARKVQDIKDDTGGTKQ